MTTYFIISDLGIFELFQDVMKIPEKIQNPNKTSPGLILEMKNFVGLCRNKHSPGLSLFARAYCIIIAYVK